MERLAERERVGGGRELLVENHGKPGAIRPKLFSNCAANLAQALNSRS